MIKGRNRQAVLWRSSSDYPIGRCAFSSMAARSISTDVASSSSKVDKYRSHIPQIGPFSPQKVFIPIVDTLLALYFSSWQTRHSSQIPVQSSRAPLEICVHIEVPVHTSLDHLLSFLHAARKARHAELSLCPIRAVDLAPSLSSYACSNPVGMAARSNHPGTRGFRV